MTSYILKSNQIVLNFMEEFNKLPHDGTKQVTIEDVKLTRSQQQNRLYWKWLGIIGQHNGNTAEELHEYMKGLWSRIHSLEPEYTEIMGRKTIKPLTTTRFTVQEMTKLLDLTQALADKLNVTLPSPSFYGYDV